MQQTVFRFRGFYKWPGAGVLWIWLSMSAMGQSRLFHKLTVEDGLSQNAVLSFAQDRQGFMWIGTSSGLNRYDSRTFQVFKQQPGDSGSISGNNVSCLLVDHRDRLWAGTTNGISRYNRQTGQFEHFLRSDGKTLPGSHVIRCLLEDQRRQLWIGTGRGLYVFREGRPMEEIRLPGNVGNSDIRAIKEDIKGDVWVGAGTKVVRIARNFSERVMTVYSVEVPGASLEDRTCTSLEEDEQHTLWLGTMGSGLFRFNEQTQRFEGVANALRREALLPHDYVRKLRADRQGKLWIGTQQGLSELDLKTGRIINHQHNPLNRYSLSQNSIYDVFTDQTGNLWIGTYYGGVNISYARNTPFDLIQATGKPDGLSSNVVSTIFYEEGRGLWIGTDAGGVSFRDDATGNWQQYRFDAGNTRSLGSDLVKCIYKDTKNRIWIGTHGGGLNLLDADRQGFTRFKRIAGQAGTISSNDVMSIVEDEQGKLWLPTENNGLSRFDPENRTFEVFHPDSVGDHHFPTLYLRSLLIDRSGNIWVASEGGLLLRKRGSNRFALYNQQPSAGQRFSSGEAVRALYEDSRKQLWIGTANQGIVVLPTGEETLRRYTQKEGLPSNNIKGMTEDLSGDMWITTDRGLCRYERQSRQFIPFTIHDGLPGNDFNMNSFYRRKDGRIFVGGLNGMIHFDPAGIQKNIRTDQIRFSQLRIGNAVVDPHSRPDILDEEISNEQEIHLWPDDNLFTLDFRLLNFIKSKKHQFLIRLEGFEKDWTWNQSGSVTYTNLPSGTYRLLVKAANNDGIWQPATAALGIVVHPPFWASWWAYLLYVAGAVYLVFLIIRYFWMEVKYRQQQQLQQYKIDFFTNISHEIRTQLTLISAPLQALREDELTTSGRQLQLDIVQKHTRKLTEMVTELLDFRKAENGHLQLCLTDRPLWPLVRDIAGDFEAIALKKGIELQCNGRDEKLEVRFDPEQMRKVIGNLISNAIKFTEKGGKVGIELKQKDSQAILRIWDTGIGIEPRYFRKLFTNFFQVNDERMMNTGYGIGLALAKRLVELQGGEIEVSSKVKKPGHGGFTVFTIRLPLANNKDTTEEILASKPGSIPVAIHREKPMILVAEDNDDLRRFIMDALSGDYELLEASDGEEGCRSATENIPDLIISDIMMPVMDGLELCRCVKQDISTSHIPILILTAKATTEDQITGLKSQADAYMTKPFDLRLLRTQVQNLIKNRLALQQAYQHHYLSSGKKEVQVSISPDPFLQQVVQTIEESMDDVDFTVSDLAKKVAMSQPVLYKKIKAMTGLSVNDFIKSLKMKKASELLLEGKLNVSEVAFAVGFSDRKYFSREFRKQFGKTPSDFADVNT